MTVPTKKERLAHAEKHCELWNAGKKEEWIASWRTIVDTDQVVMFDPVGITHSIETFRWCDDGSFLIKTYYEMPEHVGENSDPYEHTLKSQK